MSTIMNYDADFVKNGKWPQFTMILYGINPIG